MRKSQVKYGGTFIMEPVLVNNTTKWMIKVWSDYPWIKNYIYYIKDIIRTIGLYDDNDSSQPWVNNWRSVTNIFAESGYIVGNDFEIYDDAIFFHDMNTAKRFIDEYLEPMACMNTLSR